MTIDGDKAPRKRPLRCACGSMRFFVYGDRNDVVCVKCRAVFHVYPLPAEVGQARDKSVDLEHGIGTPTGQLRPGTAEGQARDIKSVTMTTKNS
jgi:hypothetical protein